MLKWKTGRVTEKKTRAQPHQGTRRFRVGFFPRLAVFAFSSLQKLNVLGADGLMFS